MRTFSIRAAKTHLSRLIDQAAKGESFVITKAGKPLVKVIALDEADDVQVDSTGSSDCHIEVPADFDQMGAAEIEKHFTDEA
jgi:prevent-host-death family protein